MRKYTYTVTGLNSLDDEQKIISAVRSQINVESITASLRSSSITFQVSDNVSKEEIEEKLKSALAAEGYELIIPEGVKTYIPAKKKHDAKHIPLTTAIILAVLVGLFCAMLTFGVCSRFLNDTSETPEYMRDLIKLDEFFRTHSYNGINNENFGEELLKAYVQFSGDQYAAYYTDEEYNAEEQDRVGKFVGIGVDIARSSIVLGEEKITTIKILSVYDNSTAKDAGILAGDMITHIGISDSAKTVDSLTYNVAVSMLSGKEDTYADFTVYRQGESGVYDKLEFSVQRKTIVKDSVKGSVCTTDEKIGIIRIRNFDYTTPTQFENAFDKLIESGCEYFVIDLRGNPGGHVESVVSVLSYFLSDSDVVMTTEDRDGNVAETWVVKTRKNDSFEITKDDIGKYKDKKICVLTDKNTASAAELFSATVRDYELGSLIGETTYGKGIMQRTYKLDSYGLPGALKITTHYYFSKSQTSYHEKGIAPDVEATLSQEAKQYTIGYIPHDIDAQLQAAIEHIKNN